MGGTPSKLELFWTENGEVSSSQTVLLVRGDCDNTRLEGWCLPSWTEFHITEEMAPTFKTFVLFEAQSVRKPEQTLVCNREDH